MRINLSISSFKMRKFILKISKFSIVVLTILVLVNFWGDAAFIFHANYEEKIISILMNSQNATNITNYDDRILQRELISKLKNSPDILVMGSSRTMLINSTFFDHQKMINNSVTGATIKDLIAIYQMYKQKNLLPKRIILGIDPWLFSVNSGQKKWLTLNKEYLHFFYNKTTIYESNYEQIVKQLFSFSYFQASLSNLPNVISGEFEPIASDKIYNQSNTKVFDGSITYDKESRTASTEEVNNKAKQFISGRIYALEGYREISSSDYEEFQQLCDSITANGIELSFILTPYHPIVYAKLNESYKMVLAAEEKVLAFAKERDIVCFGSFNPNLINIEERQFYDGMHCKESALKEIMHLNTDNNTYIPITQWN